MSDITLLKSPLFILKKLQRTALQRTGGILQGRILDIGCGQSPYRDLCSADGYIGMDNSSNTSASLIGDAVDLPFKDRTVDGVILTEVIEHVPVPEDLMSEVARVIKCDGYLYMTAPMSWCLHYEPNDYYRFTPYALKYLLRKNGLSAIRVSRIGGFCSLISVRLMDVLFEGIQRLLFFLKPRWREKIGLLFVLPLSILLYYASLVLDRVDARDAIGWAVLARKQGEVLLS